MANSRAIRLSQWSPQRLLRRLPPVQRMIQHLVRLEQRLADLEGSRTGTYASGGSIHALLTEIIESRLGQVTKDLECSNAALVHESRQEMHQILGEITTRMETLEQTKLAMTEIGQVTKDLELSNAALVHESRQEMHQILGEITTRMKTLEQTKLAMTEIAHSKKVADLVKEEWRLIAPKDPKGARFIRVGRNGDGGYVMLEPSQVCNCAISIGVGTELSWDVELADRGLFVYLYDDTISELPLEHSRFTFRRCGLRSSNAQSPRKLSLPEILSSEGLDDQNDLVLKVDIEGDEWEVFRNASPTVLEHFSQIIVEFHGLADFSDHDEHLKRLYALRSIARTHQVVHVHPNNWGAYSVVGGIPVPDVLEITYASRRMYAFDNCKRTFPTSLDYPNNADRADLVLCQELLALEQLRSATPPGA